MVTGKGIEDENLQLLGAIGVAGASIELPVVLGADFQIASQEIVATGVPEKLSCKVVEPSDDMGTCRGQAGMSSSDFFVVEGNLAKGVEEVVTVLD
eukprot:15509811-Heterocapsa_arctica.AAC.1